MLREVDRRNLILASPNCRYLDRRWAIAVSIVNGYAKPKIFRKVMDADIQLTIDYYRRFHQGDDFVRPPFVDIHRTWDFRYGDDYMAKIILEARLLTQASIDETAVACKLPVETVRLYESLFFAVRDKLQHKPFIFGYAIGPMYWEGYTERHLDILVKSLAYKHGSVYLDYILPYFTTPFTIPLRLNDLTLDELRLLEAKVSTRAVVEALTMPCKKARALYERRTAGEPLTQWEGLASELRSMIADRSKRHAGEAILASLSPATVLVASYAASQTAGGHERTSEAISLAG